MHERIVDGKRTAQVTMLLLALYPLLNYYSTPLLPLGYVLFLLYIGYKCLVSNFKKQFVFPKPFLVFWAYAAITIFFASGGIFKLSFLFPGGFTFCLWAILLGFVIRHFNLDLLQKYLKIIFFAAFIVLVLQQFMYWTTGSQFVAFIPLTNELTLSVDYEELSRSIIASDRSCAFFSEPAHFAQYVLVLLGIEFFKKENREKLITITAVFIIISLLLLRSGNGFIGLLVLLVIKFLDYFKANGYKSVIVLIIVVPLAWYGFSRYAETEGGEAAMSRTEEITTTDRSGHSFYRLFRGYIIYSNMPVINQAVGATPDYLYTMSIPFLHESGEQESDMYFNGIQSVLIFNGLIGLILLVLFYIKEAMKAEMLGKAQSLLLLTLSLIGQMYLGPIMLLCTGIMSSQKKIINEK